MKRPLGFTILSVFLAYVTVGGIAKGLHFASVYGSISGILGFIYGLSAMSVAIGLWLFRPWAFHATIVFAMSVLFQLFNYQYGLNGKYTLPLQFFIPYVFFICFLLVLLIYYVHKKLKEAGKQYNDMIKSIIYSYAIFLVASFINFAITIHFISRNIIPIAIYNTLLNLIPIYLLSRYLISPSNNNKINKIFWTSTIILSVLLVIPYGGFVLDYALFIFRAVTKYNGKF